MSTKRQDDVNARAGRTLLLVGVTLFGSLYILDWDVDPPRGNPLVYAAATSWIFTLPVAMGSGASFRNLSHDRFSLARWERHGAIYDRVGVQGFQWVLLHSPLGWFNPNMYLSGRHDCDRLLREMNAAEGVHWLTGLLSVALAIWLFTGGHAAYGYGMLVINVPFNVYPIMLQRRNRGRVWKLALSRPGQSSKSIPSA